LIDELSHARLRESSPGVFRMDHDPSRHDDRAIALAMCAHTLLSGAAAPPFLDQHMYAIEEGLRGRKGPRTSEERMAGQVTSEEALGPPPSPRVVDSDPPVLW
jgi:hypothetical protein